MDEKDEKGALVGQFEAKRGHLGAVAYRMLGSKAEADDAVQEAWLRVSRTDASAIDNLGGFLTTVLARVCLDMLRARKARREEPETPDGGTPAAALDDGDARPNSPEHDTLLADSVGLALLVVLDALAPAERLAFVLHDMFDLSFDEIASVIGGSPAAARQLASRARRRVQGASADPEADADLTRQREVIDAFLVASRNGDLTGLLAALAPDVVLRTDHVAVAASAAGQAAGAPRLAPEVRGAAAVASTFSGRARAARAALIDGSVGAVWAPGGKTRVAFAFTITDGRIAGIEVTADPARLGELAITILDD